MSDIKNYFYCFVIGIGLMLLAPMQKITNYSFIFPKEIILNINYILYQVGYFISIIFGMIVLIKAIMSIIKK